MNTKRTELSLLLEGIGVEARIENLHPLRPLPLTSFSSHTHTAFEVYFLKKGSMRISVSEEERFLKEGEVFIIFPQTEHFVLETSRDVEKFNLRFLLHNVNRSQFERGGLLYETGEAVRKELFFCIEGISSNIRVQTPMNAYRVKSYLGVLISHLLQGIFPELEGLKPGGGETGRNARLEQSIVMDDFFLKYYDTHITLETLAEHLHYSKTHANRLLKQIWGMSFSEKLNQTRLQAAKKQLTESEASLEQIARLCGYSTLRGFELFFKKQTGMLPSKYRQTYKPKGDDGF
ncbi:MAG: AraC family transcriptional regulator [Clostridia bacterium]|nr:AraC family transcriptional regulator [Clostridia bacterium]